MTYYTGLARVARDAGLTVREVPGWRTRTAHRGGMNTVKAVVWHHTATSASAVKSRNNPTLNYMINGLGYPLANYGLAWDGSLDVIAAGTGAHAGKGSYKGIPDGNRNTIGIEVEGTIGLTWSDAQLETAARLGAALDREWGGLLHIGHYEWAPGRKTDPTGIPGNMPALRAAIKRGHWNTITPASTTTGGLAMSDVNKILAQLGQVREQISNGYGGLRNEHASLEDEIAGLSKKVDQLLRLAGSNSQVAAWVKDHDGRDVQTRQSLLDAETHHASLEAADLLRALVAQNGLNADQIARTTSQAITESKEN